ncbi:alcohol dehydrogenase catalytic domain-containing protein [Lysinibacillus halotolerans]|uniref:Alcohol dehydrogenase-like N-terminal domain-containing protein n=1 Tax=Lysinibacillus halotolerans TaxID=1368476 RepID=A0A3M8H598_9BACI|nr:alcohol dehydrogenase catalytic domain-containing protein [Lysinibacillus halotolerans]RNC97250.1 hypothetical protein EC501_16270 [Lysinibacillus halotolerans]
MNNILTITSAEMVSPMKFNWIKREHQIENSDLIIKVLLWGICSSDYKTFKEGDGRYFGHEMVGKVLQGNEYFKVGSLVVPFHSNVNNSNKEEFNYELGFKDYLYIPPSKYDSIFTIPNTNVPDKYVFLDSLACVIHALKITDLYKTSNLNILILGEGFIANLFADILSSEKNRITFSSRKKSIKHSGNFDICIDTTGSNHFINFHLDNIRNNGLLLCFCKPDTDNMDLNKIRLKEIKLQYSRFCKREDVITAIEQILNNRIKFDKYITTYNGEEYLRKAFEDFANKSIIRGVIRIGED